jgi:hypothetical protein
VANTGYWIYCNENIFLLDYHGGIWYNLTINVEKKNIPIVEWTDGEKKDLVVEY